MESHFEVKLEKYSQVLNIEVETMLEMINKDILPAAFKYLNNVAETANKVKSVYSKAKCTAETRLIEKLDGLADELAVKAEELAETHLKVKQLEGAMKVAKAYAEKVLPLMAETRAVADEIEPLLGEGFKPYPCYEDLLYRV